MHRRARHLNPGSAGAVLALDSRFIRGLSDGDPVSTWPDRSGQGNDATQTGSARPTFETAEQGGNPLVLFDGTDDSMTLNNLTDNNSATIAVVKPTAVTDTKAVLVCDGISLYTSLSGGIGGGDKWGTFVSSTVTDSNLSSAQPYILCLNVRSTSDMDLVLNGVVNTKTPGGSWPSRGATKLASDPTNVHHQDGYFGQVVVSPAFSSSLRRRLEHAAAFSFKIPCQ